MTLRLAEEPFLSCQGEGPHAGEQSVFLRLSGCNLRCGFCDTKHSWEEGTEYSLDELTKKINSFKAERIVTTGGEPLLQQQELVKLLHKSIKILDTEIETNGTIEPAEFLYNTCSFIVSPKFKSSGKQSELAPLFQNSCFVTFKFVIGSDQDLKEMEQFIKKYNIYTLNKIFLMPQGITPEEVDSNLPRLFKFVKRNGKFKISPRLQISAFGNVKGV